MQPVSALRWMADRGQCARLQVPRAGLPIIPDIEQIGPEDPWNSVDLITSTCTK